MTPIDFVFQNIESSITQLNDLSSPNGTQNGTHCKTAIFIANLFFGAKTISLAEPDHFTV